MSLGTITLGVQRARAFTAQFWLSFDVLSCGVLPCGGFAYFELERSFAVLPLSRAYFLIFQSCKLMKNILNPGLSTFSRTYICFLLIFFLFPDLLFSSLL